MECGVVGACCSDGGGRGVVGRRASRPAPPALTLVLPRGGVSATYYSVRLGISRMLAASRPGLGPVLAAYCSLLLLWASLQAEANSLMHEEELEVVNISAILNQFMVGYDKRVRPNYGGIPVTVGVSLYILSIGDLSEKFMDFTFDMYFRQFWHDPRLAFEKKPNLNKLVVGAEYIKLIWVPDTFFVNEKVALFHQATTENQFLRIMPTGDVLRSIRLTIKATCPLDLQVTTAGTAALPHFTAL